MLDPAELPSYRHTQRAGRIVSIALALSIAGAIVGIIVGWHGAARGPRVAAPVNLVVPVAVVIVAIITLLQFSTLTIQVDATDLHWWFGPAALPVIRKSVPLSDIAQLVVVRNPLWYGWGIHLTTRGWLYNIAGRDGIEVSLRSGQRFRIGTDEPEALAEAIRERGLT
jgi:hypothetical protein